MKKEILGTKFVLSFASIITNERTFGTKVIHQISDLHSEQKHQLETEHRELLQFND